MTNLGIYEKALPKGISWLERLEIAKKLGFQFMEMSIDETDERLSRLEWSKDEIDEVRQAMDITGVRIYSICLSGHRRYPLGSRDDKKREKALLMMRQAIDLAEVLGIRNIQLAGYDVYYEEKSVLTQEYFIENLTESVKMAAQKQIMLSIEIMDDPFINSLAKFLSIKKEIPSPWLQAYPDIGNLSAWPDNNIGNELSLGLDAIAAVHLKDTRKVSEFSSGQFKNVPFGEGDVDFLGSLKVLKRLGYQGSFLIEMWSEESSDPISHIQEAKDYLIPILKEAGYIELQTDSTRNEAASVSG